MPFYPKPALAVDAFSIVMKALKNKTEGSKTLKNARQELFCRLYTGECWEQSATAYREAGYSVTSEKQAENAAGKLLKIPEIALRIKYLKRHQLNGRSVNPDWINEVRRQMAENAKSESVRLHALQHLEKSLAASEKDEAGSAPVINIYFAGRAEETEN